VAGHGIKKKKRKHFLKERKNIWGKRFNSMWGGGGGCPTEDSFIEQQGKLVWGDQWKVSQKTTDILEGKPFLGGSLHHEAYWNIGGEAISNYQDSK